MRRWIGTVTWTWHTDEVELARGRIGRAERGEGGLLEITGPPMPEPVESAGARQLRLESLRRAIAAGDYHIPAEAVARRVMDRMLVDGQARARAAKAEKLADSSGTAEGRASHRSAPDDSGS